MEDAHHTHREVTTGWIAALIEALLWNRRSDYQQDAAAGRTAPSAQAEGLHRLSSPH